ncbi:MAG: hypothetical protein K0V04_32690 [Deltaproteobacteria bacterium]|nr:hypothetical protein [Deltaproteobacteria bacterium]
MMGAAWRRARYLVRSNYGRDDGWYVELEGERIGMLTGCARAEMFWDSYAVTGIGPRATLIEQDATWEGDLGFRSRATLDGVGGAFVGGEPPLVREGRVLTRGLYLRPESRVELVLVRAVARFERRRG